MLWQRHTLKLILPERQWVEKKRVMRSTPVRFLVAFFQIENFDSHFIESNKILKLFKNSLDSSNQNFFKTETNKRTRSSSKGNTGTLLLWFLSSTINQNLSGEKCSIFSKILIPKFSVRSQLRFPRSRKSSSSHERIEQHPRKNEKKLKWV